MQELLFQITPEFEERIAKLKTLQTAPAKSTDPKVPFSEERIAYLRALQDSGKKQAVQPSPPRETLLEKADRSAHEALMGPIEGVANVGAGMAGWIGGNVAGLTRGLYDMWRTGGRGSWEDATKTKGDVSKAISSVGGLYQPQTKMGADIAQAAAYIPGKGVEYWNKGVDIITDDPETRAGLKYAGEIGVGVLTAKGLGMGIKAIPKAIRGKVPPSSMAYPSKAQGVQAVPITNMITALKKLKPLRKLQEIEYTKSRAKKFAGARGVGRKTSGEAGFYRELSKLKGELDKVEVTAEFQSIREAFSQKNIDYLVNTVKDNPILSYMETVTARQALLHIFGEKGVKIPTHNELYLLSRVFGKEFTSAIRKNWTTWKKVKHGIFEVANIPRSLMASFDLSAPFRQGLMMIGRKEFYSAFKEMFGYFHGKKSYRALLEDIAQRETYPLMQRSRLEFTDVAGAFTKREERFMSHWAEDLPIPGVKKVYNPTIGKGVEASGRAYSGFLNKLRADVFDSLIKDAERLGLDPKGNPKLTQDIATYVNSATGRGNLGVAQGASTFLNSFFFSPRLVKARLDFMNPGWYMKLEPFARKQALKSLFTVAGAGMTTLALAKMAGLEVGDDYRSTDFGKIKIGNTRIDIWGGFQQYAVLVARLASQETKSSTTGKVTKLGEGYKPVTSYKLIGRAIEFKEAPATSFITALLRGKDFKGEDIKIENELLERVTPMVIQDIMDIAKDDPDLLPTGLLGIFGVGLQTYEPRKKLVK